MLSVDRNANVADKMVETMDRKAQVMDRIIKVMVKLQIL